MKKATSKLLTADSKAYEVKEIAKRLLINHMDSSDLKDEYVKSRICRIYHIPDSEWNEIKNCICWWILYLRKENSK